MEMNSNQRFVLVDSTSVMLFTLSIRYDVLSQSILIQIIENGENIEHNLMIQVNFQIHVAGLFPFFPIYKILYAPKF